MSMSASKGTPKKLDARTKFFICPQCNNAVEEEHDCICCCSCKNWVHLECTALTPRDFQYISDEKSAKAGIEWMCESCQKGEGEQKGDMEAKLDRLIRLFESVDTRLCRLESGCSGEALEKKVETIVNQKVTELWDEKVEKEKRELNLIITNLQESDKLDRAEKQKDDKVAVKNIISKICPELEEVELDEDPIRLGRVNIGTKPRLVRIKLKSVDAKKNILSNAYKINTGVREQEKRIYFNPDLTPTERLKNKETRQELKRRIQDGETDIGIRNGRIVKVKWSPRPNLEDQKRD